MEPLSKSPFLVSIADELERWRADGLERQLRTIDSGRGVALVLDGRPVVSFTSNDYLGLASDGALAHALSYAARQGVGATASRLTAGNWAAHGTLERELAAWKHTEAALLFGSGYQANLGVVAALVGPDDLVLSDALNHASIVDGCRLSRARVAVFRHRDVDHLGSLLTQPARRRLVVSDSVFSMDGDLAPVDDLVRVCRQKGALLLLDEAHATGVLGPEGRGLAPVAPDVLQIGTLGKALGVYGAYVAGSRLLVHFILQRARSFVYTTALPTPIVAAVRAAVAWVQSPTGEAARRTLRQHAITLHEGLAALGLSRQAAPSHIAAIYAAGGTPEAAMAATEALLAEGLYVQAIRPPTVPAKTARLRLALSAGHTPAHVAQLLGALARHRSLFAGPSELS